MDPAGRPDFSHGVQMDSKPFPSSKSEIFLQGKTAVLEKVFLHGRLAGNYQVRGGKSEVCRNRYKSKDNVVNSCLTIGDDPGNPMGNLGINLGKNLVINLVKNVVKNLVKNLV